MPADLSLTWGKFYFSKFFADTLVWKAEERGFYISLLAYQFECGSIPNDPGSIMRAGGVSESEYESCWPRVSEKFQEKDGMLYNEKMTLTRDESIRRIEQAQAAGAKGGRPPSNKTDRLSGGLTGSKSGGLTASQSDKIRLDKIRKEENREDKKEVRAKTFKSVVTKSEFFISQGKIKFADFVYMYKEEHEKLIEKYGKEITEYSIRTLDEWFTNNEKQFLTKVDHYKVIVNGGWVIQKAKELMSQDGVMAQAEDLPF
jgi:uncharacterized protein YdaU (DUF1376 family)